MTPWKFKDDSDAKTAAAFDNPQVGDRFSEFRSYWVYVLYVFGNKVVIMEGFPPCELPKDGKITITTRAKFKEKFAYGSIPGYSVRLCDRGNDVAGWWSDEPKKSKPKKDLRPYAEFSEFWE